MVPTAGLEPAQIAPLAPQTSASTNFATSACHGLAPDSPWACAQLSMGLRPTFNGVAATPTENMLACGQDSSQILLSMRPSPKHRPAAKILKILYGFGGVAGAGVAGACVAGGAGAGAAGFGAGAVSTARSNTLVGSLGERVPI